MYTVDIVYTVDSTPADTGIDSHSCRNYDFASFANALQARLEVALGFEATGTAGNQVNVVPNQLASDVELPESSWSVELKSSKLLLESPKMKWPETEVGF